MAAIKPFGWMFFPRATATTIDIDRKPIVLCQDCKQWDEAGGMMGRGWCGYQMKCTGPHYFCADGKKEETDENGDV